MSETNPGRRRVPRVAASGHAVLIGRERRSASLLDLSMRGCLVRAEQPLATGRIIDIVLHIDGRPFKAKVRVAEVSVDGVAGSRYLVGLEFLDVEPEDERRLEQYMQAARRPKSSPRA
jgi:c-di-GMP-binding flagellar brake protein YcgR